MKKPTPTETTKEALETSHRLNERLRTENQNFFNESNRLREKFTTILKELRLDPYANRLSWEEIFCEVGKLLVQKRNRDWEEKVDESIRQLQEKINNIATC